MRLTAVHAFKFLLVEFSLVQYFIVLLHVQQVDCSVDKLILQLHVEWRVTGETRAVVNFYQPRFELVVDHHIESQYFEVV